MRRALILVLALGIVMAGSAIAFAGTSYLYGHGGGHHSGSWGGHTHSGSGACPVENCYYNTNSQYSVPQASAAQAPYVNRAFDAAGAGTSNTSPVIFSAPDAGGFVCPNGYEDCTANGQCLNNGICQGYEGYSSTYNEYDYSGSHHGSGHHREAGGHRAGGSCRY